MEKENSKKSAGSRVDSNADLTTDNVAALEKKIDQFVQRVSQLHNELLALRQQHQTIIDLLKKMLGEK